VGGEQGHERLLARAASAYSVRSRRLKAARLSAFVAAEGVRTILIVGAESESYAWSNIIESALTATGARVIATGLGPSIALETDRVFCDGRRLPFRDKSFDLVLSNAVIEHVGDEPDQKAFVAEHHRVGRKFFITTPNLLFPVESHTRVIGRHWSRAWRSRRRVHFTRLLSPASFKALLPMAGTTIRGHAWSPTLSATHDCAAAGRDR
jgi:hypothetical protein